MRFYSEQHNYYCGIDLHTKTMYVCIVNQAGDILVHQNLTIKSDSLLPSLGGVSFLTQQKLFNLSVG